MEEILNALELKKELDALRPIDKEHEAIIMQKFRLDWNYHSNHLEGNALTYGETKALILFGITAQGKTLKDHFEITGHNEAINWVIDMVKGERPLTENFIRELHVLLLKESYEVDAITPDGQPTKKKINVGKYKSSPNHVQTKTGEIFHFANPEETPARMTDLLNWYKEKSAEQDVNPIFLAAEFHYRFIRIHPFDDGNGRTARILMNFILMQFGFPPVIIKSEDKENYFIALQLADAGNIESFIEYIAKNLVRSLEIMIAGAKGENVEEPDDLDKEIALLEQRLNGLSKKSEKLKSKQIILDVFDKTFLELNDKIDQTSRKFNKFYLENKLYYKLKQNEPKFYSQNIYFNQETTEFRDLDLLRKKIDENTLEIYANILFKNFNRVGFGKFRFEIKFKIVFSDVFYSILANNKSLVEKPYGIQLTTLEIDKIVKSEMKRHQEFIEKKISEKENEK